MVTHSRSSSASPGPHRRRPKNWARRCERYCCSVATYFPLVFVYGLTTWAVWVESRVGLLNKSHTWTGQIEKYVLKPPLTLVRQNFLCCRDPTLSPPQLVLYHRCIYRPRLSSYVVREFRLLSSPYPRALLSSRPNIVYGQVYGRGSILQKMPKSEARPCASLLDMSAMCFENGSSLPMVGNMRGASKLQAILTIFNLYNNILLAMLCGHWDLVVARNFN